MRYGWDNRLLVAKLKDLLLTYVAVVVLPTPASVKKEWRKYLTGVVASLNEGTGTSLPEPPARLVEIIKAMDKLNEANDLISRLQDLETRLELVERDRIAAEEGKIS